MNKYVIVEGLDFSGKSTFIEKLSKDLTTFDIPHVTVSEPTKHYPRGIEIYDLITKANITVEEKNKLLLEQREALLTDIILPALKEGKMVISDRSFISNLVYQGEELVKYGKVLEDNIKLFSEMGDISLPTHCIHLRLTHEEYLERTSKSVRHLDRLEHRLLDKVEFEEYERRYEDVLNILGNELKLFKIISSKELLCNSEENK